MSFPESPNNSAKKKTKTYKTLEKNSKSERTIGFIACLPANVSKMSALNTLSAFKALNNLIALGVLHLSNH